MLQDIQRFYNTVIEELPSNVADLLWVEKNAVWSRGMSGGGKGVGSDYSISSLVLLQDL
jgi:hypothetical protein